MKGANVVLSSKSDEWTTPQSFFDEWSARLGGFTIDLACTNDNKKCERGLTDSLAADWRSEIGGGIAWCNPPYSSVAKWVEKADLCGKRVAMLIPARTCTKWFHAHILGRHEVIFIKGRLKFGDAKWAAPFPSMLVLFNFNDNAKAGKDKK